jgi:multidrug resistance efflux pump
MKKALVVLVAIIGLGLVGMAYGQKGDTTRGMKVSGKTVPFKFTGVVKSVDKDAKTIVVTTPQKGDVAFRLDRAKFEGEYTMADKVNVGDQVSGKGSSVDDQNWVSEMTRAGAPEK